MSAAAAAPIDDSATAGAALGISAAQLEQLQTRLDAPPAEAGPTAVWPDNAETVTLFESLATQWRVGPGGAYALDYAVLPGVAQSCGMDSHQAWRALPALQVMEDEALLVFGEQMRAAAEA